MIRAQHVDKSAWNPVTDKTCKCTLWESNFALVNDFNGQYNHVHMHRLFLC